MLPLHRVLHTGSLGGKTSPPLCLKEPPEVLLDGQRIEYQDDAGTLLFCYRQQHQQEEQPEEIQINPSPSEPLPELRQEQLQDILALGGACVFLFKACAPELLCRARAPSLRVG